MVPPPHSVSALVLEMRKQGGEEALGGHRPEGKSRRRSQNQPGEVAVLAPPTWEWALATTVRDSLQAVHASSEQLLSQASKTPLVSCCVDVQNIVSKDVKHSLPFADRVFYETGNRRWWGSVHRPPAASGGPSATRRQPFLRLPDHRSTVLVFYY